MLLFPSFNLWLFSLIHAEVGQSTVLDFSAIFFADYVQYVIAGLFVLLFFRTKNRSRNRVIVILATVAALAARYIAKPFILFFVAETRPFIYLHFTPLVTTLTSEDFQSFPSGHALFFFALATTVFCFRKKLGAYLFGVAIVMGLSRIYVGVHWPFDIVVGAGIGIGVGVITYLMYYYQKQLVETSIGALEKRFRL